MAVPTAPLSSTDIGAVRKLEDSIATVVRGKPEAIRSAVIALLSRGHLLIEDIPGVGKTILARALAGATGGTCKRVQCVPDLMPADITGTTIVRDVEAPSSAPGAPRSMSRQFVFERGPIFAQILLADEINRATPKTQSALLEAMQERSVTVGGTTHPLPRPFLVLATQNPLEQEGTYPLPEAQLDRFFFKVLVGYSSRKDLAEILARTTGGRGAEVEPVLNEQTILEHQRPVERCAITPSVTDYAVRVVLATHPAPSAESRAAGALTAAPGDSSGAFATPMTNRYVRVGASPRAAQAMVLGAKCRALLDNRASVAVEDIQWTAKAALRHRIILNFEAAAEGIQPDQIIDNILATTPRVAE